MQTVDKNGRIELRKSEIVQIENQLSLNEDYIFTSPSLAAAIVMGRNANGLEEWKLKNGQTLKGFELTNQSVEWNYIKKVKRLLGVFSSQSNLF